MLANSIYKPVMPMEYIIVFAVAAMVAIFALLIRH
jgi:hypothetical protein